ncbi:uncharacterized protein [Ptychodera flava]|uniref:uncharacterized protein n=1 Tax=Ptychodera flava TaxID=63121 RepID=UPI003969FA42
MTDRLSIVFLVIAALFIGESLAESADLKVTRLIFSNPDPSQATPIYTVDTAVTVVLATFYVDNDGPDNLAAAASGNNYDVKMYLSVGDDMTDPQEITTFSFTDSSSNLANSLNSGASHFYLAPNFDITYPSNLCRTHSHVCLQVEKEAGAVYTDPDTSNNYYCVPFDMGVTDAAGYTTCPSDPVPYNLTLEGSNTFTSGVELNVTVTVAIENQGGTPVEGSTSSEDNIAFTRIFLANAQSEGASRLADFSNTIGYTYSDVSSDIGPWGVTTYTGIKASVTLPDAKCSSYQYLCLLFSLGANGSSNFDDTTSNNLVCGELGSPADGGIGDTVCPEVTTLAPNVTADTGEASQGSGGGYVRIHGGVIFLIILIFIIVGAVAALLIEFGVKKYLKKREEKKNAVSIINVQGDETKGTNATKDAKELE